MGRWVPHLSGNVGPGATRAHLDLGHQLYFSWEDVNIKGTALTKNKQTCQVFHCFIYGALVHIQVDIEKKNSSPGRASMHLKVPIVRLCKR